MNSLETTIRSHLDAYLSDALSLEGFTAWLVGATWNIDNTGDEAATELAFAIELALAEHTSGLTTLVELRQALRGLSQLADPSVPV